MCYFFHKIITFCPNEQNRLRFFIFLSVWYFLHFIKKYSHKHAFLFEVFCTDIISMQPAVHMDSLSFDHIDFDVKHSFFPKNSCSFIVNMSSILIPQDTSPTFAALYEDCLGEPNDFEAVAFYGDFTRLVNTRLMTPTMQQQVVDYFWISLHQIQPLILCVLKHSLKIQTSKKLQQKEELKITTNLLYEHVVKTAMTKRWHSNSLKKMTTCKVTYLVKADNFWDGVKMENSLMASLPPIHEINTQMYEELLTALEHRRQAEADFVFEVLPSYVDKIKL